MIVYGLNPCSRTSSCCIPKSIDSSVTEESVDRDER